MSNEQISLPSLVAILVVLGLILRYLFSGGSPPPQSTSRSPEAIRRSREIAAERIQQMFPQADRRNILWDLQRNGGNIQSTTERILAGRLETVRLHARSATTRCAVTLLTTQQPPITFQPPPPPGQASSSANSSTSTRQQPHKPTQPDLITRYNLGGKLDTTESRDAVDKKGKGWSSNRDERQASLQRRRDEMILAARRRMEAQLATETSSGAS